MQSQTSTRTDSRAPTLRVAQFEDAPAVKLLAMRNGLSGELNADAWQMLWTDNPNYFPGWTIGWVLELEQKVVGYIGNVPRRYRLQGQSISVACARAFVVDQAFRRHALKLLAAFYAQESADLFLFTGANQMAAPLYAMAQAQLLPQPDFNDVLYWVISASGLINSALRKRKIPSCVARLIGCVAGPLIDMGLRFIYPKTAFDQEMLIKEIRVSEIGSAFDDFWLRWCAAAGEVCTADRSAEQIRWQFEHPSVARAATLLGIWQGEQLMGFVTLVRWDASAVGLRRFLVADLVAVGHQPQLIHSLMAATLAHAHSTGVHVVQCTGLPQMVRKSLRALKPHNRTLTDSAFYYFSKRATLVQFLSSEAHWYVCTMDGDTAL
jgi:hypothetical protein